MTGAKSGIGNAYPSGSANTGNYIGSCCSSRVSPCFPERISFLRVIPTDVVAPI